MGIGPAALLLTALALAAGCVTPVAAVTDYTDADLSGQIDGKTWVYKHAYTDPTLRTPNEDDVVFVFLSYLPKDKCPKSQDDQADHRSAMVAAPQSLKQIKIKAGTQRNLVFQYDDKDGAQIAKSARKGKLKLTAVHNGTVTGKLFATAGPGNWISGNFSAVLCNSLDLR